MPITHYAANLMVAKMFGATNYTPPANFYLALFTGLPSLAGGGTEVAGGSYARVAIPNNNTIFPAPTVSSTATTALYSFPTPSAGWGTIVAVGIYDASSAGNLIGWYQLPTPRVINTGDNYAFPIGNIIARNV